MEVLDGKFFFLNYRMGKIWFISNSFLKYLDECDMPNCQYGSGEKLNVDVYGKCTLCPSTYVNQPITCATTSTHIWVRA